MYCFEETVMFSRTDVTGAMSLKSVIDDLQDAATAQSNEVGYTWAKLREMGCAWVLSSWQVNILRMPKEGEQIRVITIPYEMRGMLGRRNFILETLEGEHLIEADSLWALVDIVEGKPVRVPAGMPEAYQLGEKLQMEYAPRRIKLPEAEPVHESPIPLRRHMLDANGHMNNSQYVSIASDFLPEGFVCRRIRVEYKKPVLPGMMMHPVSWRFDGGLTLQICDENGGEFAVVEFIE